MQFEYHATLVNTANSNFKNTIYSIDPSNWIEYIRERPSLYGNLASELEKFLPLLKDPIRGCGATASFARQIDMTLGEINGNAIFEFVMFCWHQFKSGEIPAESWAGALGWGWQSGKRGMLGGVRLPQNTVIEMFKSAPPDKLYWVSTGKDDWINSLKYLPDEVQVYRGISTCTALREQGFSWTPDLLQAWQFAAFNTHSRKEQPIVISALIPKHAVLAAFKFESEIVVNPLEPKTGLSQITLKSGDLKEFYKAYKIGKHGEIPGIGNINSL